MIKKVFCFLCFSVVIGLASVAQATGPASVYKITITKLELHNGSSWVTVFDGTSTTIDIASVDSGSVAGNFVAGLEVPDGTYSQSRTTVSTTFTISGSDTGVSPTRYTTATVGGNGGCVPTTTAGNEAECTITIGSAHIETTTFSQPITMTNGNASHKLRINFDTSNGIEYNGGANEIFTATPVVTIDVISLG